MSEPEDIVMRAVGVSHGFGRPGSPGYLQTLDNVDLEIRRGEMLALIGPSGCGKTTLLNMFSSLTKPTAGRIEVGGAAVSGPMPDTVAFVFQEHALFPWLSVLGNLRTALKFKGLAAREAADRARAALDQVGLADFADHFPRQLSGGMRQRASLARALSLDTPIILMDEPFAALDEQTRMVLGEDLSALLGRTGKTIILVTHSLGEAVMLADRIAVFSARPGRITTILEVDEPHPRQSHFVTSEAFARLRARLYDELHDQIRRSMTDPVHRRAGPMARTA